MPIGSALIIHPVAAVLGDEVAVLIPQNLDRLAVDEIPIFDGNAHRKNDGIVGADLVQFPAVELIKQDFDVLPVTDAPGREVNPFSGLDVNGIQGSTDLVEHIVG